MKKSLIFLSACSLLLLQSVSGFAEMKRFNFPVAEIPAQDDPWSCGVRASARTLLYYHQTLGFGTYIMKENRGVGKTVSAEFTDYMSVCPRSVDGRVAAGCDSVGATPKDLVSFLNEKSSRVQFEVVTKENVL